MERDTLVIFMTDNGGAGGVKVFNVGMRPACVFMEVFNGIC